jgi:hypothetical protein
MSDPTDYGGRDFQLLQAAVVRLARTRSVKHQYWRGLAVASIALAPVLACMVPAAHAEVGTTSPTTLDTGTTPDSATSPATYGTASTTVPTTDTTATSETTDPTVPTTDTTGPTATDPTTVPPTDPSTTVPPVTDPPPTDPVTTLPPDTTPPATTPPVSTPDTTPSSVPAVVVPTPTSGDGSGPSGSVAAPTNVKPKATKSKSATPPMRQLVEVFPQDLGAGGKNTGPMRAVAAAISVPNSVRNRIETAASASAALTAQLSDAFNPNAGDNSWGGLGSSAPRFGPWIVLLAVAWLARTVAASVLADRTAGPRRRRWTLL